MTVRNKLFPIFPIKFVILTFIQIIGLKKEMFMAKEVFLKEIFYNKVNYNIINLVSYIYKSFLLCSFENSILSTF